MDQMQRFWMVWKHNGGGPAAKHWTKEDAVVEAKRLASQHVGSRFVVLKSVDCFEASRPDVSQIELVKLPVEISNPPF